MNDKTTKNKLIGHNEARNRYIFTGLLKLEHPLHIGSGLTANDTTSPIIRDQNNYPLIPGSSLRGAFRARVERLVRGLQETKVLGGMACCILFEDGTTDCPGTNEKKAKELSKIAQEKGEQVLWEKLEESLCDVCKLFGVSTFFASRLRITDSQVVLTKDPPDKALTATRHGVGINRDTGTAAHGVKFDHEVALANLSFRMEMILENASPRDLQLLAMGFSELEHGHIALGGKSGRGLGKVRLIDGNYELFKLTDKAALKNYLMTGKPTEEGRLSTFTQRHLNELFGSS